MGVLHTKSGMVGMSRNQKIGVGATIAIAGLILTIVSMGTGTAVGYGSLKQAVEDASCTAHEADARSISNQSLINRIDGKLDLIIQQTRK